MDLLSAPRNTRTMYVCMLELRCSIDRSAAGGETSEAIIVCHQQALCV